ncbi:MAG TPA: hypothetical protein VFJ29_05185, partial [Candidatus Kapabacteria bacterium]|nr:hypothetical protein [Candidatus Kapabacteria bacterium]
MLDNGDNTKTSTLQFGGASAQTLDLTNIRTSADTVLIGMNLHTTGTIDATSGVLQTNNVTRIDNNGNGSFAGLTSTGAVTVGYSIPAFNV